MEKFSYLIAQYGATLSTKDVDILRKIYTLDGNSSICKFNPFIWGESAPVYYSTVADARFTLFKMPKASHVLGQYKKDKILRTLKQFPIHLPLDPLADYNEDRPDMYDPRFILTTLYHILGPENAINCNQIIKSYGLSIMLAGTSSASPSMRNLSYMVIERFFYHLEGSKSASAVYFWIHFINCFRASIHVPNQRVSFLLTSLLVHIIEIIDTPKDSLFYAVKDFVTAKPKFDSHQISTLFINLLKTKELEWKKCQKFVLNLISKSIKSEDDFDVCRSNNLCNYILSIYSSEWCDLDDRMAIIKFLKSCLDLPIAVKVLIIEYGLIVWLTNIIVLSTKKMDSREKEELRDLIKKLKISIKSTDLPKNCSAHPLKLVKACLKQ